MSETAQASNGAVTERRQAALANMNSLFITSGKRLRAYQDGEWLVYSGFRRDVLEVLSILDREASECFEIRYDRTPEVEVSDEGEPISSLSSRFRPGHSALCLSKPCGQGSLRHHPRRKSATRKPKKK